jgi:N-acetylglutamate synthase-like GNAT family acetyltransferase
MCEKVEIVDTSADNICDFGFCGFKSIKQEGYRRKTAWLKKRFSEGMKFKVLHTSDEGTVGFIEYIPGEYAWRPIEAPEYMVIHCIMIHRRKYKGKGYGSQLLEHCIRDARKAGLAGVAVVTSRGTWMAGGELFAKNGFECVDTAPPSFELMVKKLREAPLPKFKGDWEKRVRKYDSGVVIIRSDQCPMIANCTAGILDACGELGVPVKVVELKNHRQAQSAPSAYGIFNIVYNGKLIADHPIGEHRFRNIMGKIAQGR